jgi:hypothetical protein
MSLSLGLTLKKISMPEHLLRSIPIVGWMKRRVVNPGLMRTVSSANTKIDSQLMPSMIETVNSLLDTGNSIVQLLVGGSLADLFQESCDFKMLRSDLLARSLMKPCGKLLRRETAHEQVVCARLNVCRHARLLSSMLKEAGDTPMSSLPVPAGSHACHSMISIAVEESLLRVIHQATFSGRAVYQLDNMGRTCEKSLRKTKVPAKPGNILPWEIRLPKG